MAIRQEAPGNRGGDDSLRRDDGSVSQFTANKLGNWPICEGEQTQPQMFTRNAESDRRGTKELPGDGVAAFSAEVGPGGQFVEALARCDPVSGQPLIGLSRTVAARAEPLLGYPQLAGANDEGRDASR